MIQVPALVASDLAAGTRREWLETNGLGSYAMGTVAGPSTRRYHAILCVATEPPLARMVLVNRLEETVVVDGVPYDLSTSFYPGAVHPMGHRAIVGFRLDPWPTWRLRAGGAVIERSLFMPHGRQMTIVTWRLVEAAGGSGRGRLFVRPLISGRDAHALHHENAALRRDAQAGEGLVALHPYDGVPAVRIHHNGTFIAKPDWYRRFQYPLEQERGLDAEEDLFCPGELQLDLVPETDAVAIFTVESGDEPSYRALVQEERLRRAALDDGATSELERELRHAADKFLVRRGDHRSVIAGYPWFGDWGRDTFISLPGFALATGWPALGRELVLGWAQQIKNGLIPNRFCDGAGGVEYNAVDAPLWYVVAAARLLDGDAGLDAATRAAIVAAMRAIIDGFLDGHHAGIAVEDDGLVHAAAPGLALTWMDARVGERVITPRQGKPVEVQALWVAALEAAARQAAAIDPAWTHELDERAAWARSSFAATFWNEETGWLFDVVDGPRRDATLRPNQLYALGLCQPLVDAERAERALSACERELVTPVGLRSRARDPQYRGRMVGDVAARDGAYHEGTVWPFLLGIYADASMRVRGRVAPGLLDGLRAHLAGEGLGNLAEVFDGDAPHHARGCPAQAWSVAEALRVLVSYGR